MCRLTDQTVPFIRATHGVASALVRSISVAFLRDLECIRAFWMSFSCSAKSWDRSKKVSALLL